MTGALRLVSMRVPVIVSLPVLHLAVGGCAAEPPGTKDTAPPSDSAAADSPDTGSADSDSADSDSEDSVDTDTAPGPTIDASFTFGETLFGEPVAGATVTVDGQEGAGTTDADGGVTVPVEADAPFVVVATAVDHPDAWFHGYAWSGAFGVISAWPSEVALDELAALAGVTRDPAAGTLLLAFLTSGEEFYPTESAGPFSFTVDAPYDGAVEMLDGAPTGYVPGDSPGGTGFAAAILFNVPAGTRTVTHTGNPGGCAVWEFADGPAAPEIEVRADTLTILDFLVDCD